MPRRKKNLTKKPKTENKKTLTKEKKKVIKKDKEFIEEKGKVNDKEGKQSKGEIVKFKKEIKPAVYFAVGRRKEAVARVRLYTGLPKEENKIYVNDRLIEEYFPGEIAKKAYIEPFRTTNTIGRFKVTVKVEGSGKIGQLGACVLGFARAIEQVDKLKFRPILKKRGLLKRDARVKERRKVGTGGKARREKQSPKR